MIYTGTYKSSFRANAATFPSVSFKPAVISSGLAYVDVVCVKVDGFQYDIIHSGVPGNRQVLYGKSLGVLIFGVSIGTQDVFVMYQK